MLGSSSFRDLGLMNKFVLYTITFRSNNKLRQSEQYTKKGLAKLLQIPFNLMNERLGLLLCSLCLLLSEVKNILLVSLHTLVFFLRTNNEFLPLT